MLDRKKVIKGLEEAVRVIESHVPERYRGYSRLSCYDAIALLREQEAQETRFVHRYSRPGVYADVLLHCEKCNGAVDNYRLRYCPWCGRKVKWDADE